MNVYFIFTFLLSLLQTVLKGITLCVCVLKDCPAVCVLQTSKAFRGIKCRTSGSNDGTARADQAICTA